MESILKSGMRVKGIIRTATLKYRHINIKMRALKWNFELKKAKKEVTKANQ